jgi:hypothetical protein
MDHHNLRQAGPGQASLPNEETVNLGGLEEAVKDASILQVELSDGSVSINFAPHVKTGAGDDTEHEENLALHVDSGELAGVADNLLRHIREDITRQEQRLQDVVKGIDLLGIKLEEPRAEPNDEGISVVRHPLLLEAVLRFQANARGEMLPADGPVKVANDGDQTVELDAVANALEQDMNHYLTVGAPEYYPDTDRMFFTLGHGGEAYKKVYFHPIKRRPVSETVDRKDLILSDGAVSLEACSRITHRSKMRPSEIKRMQLAGVWREAPLGPPAMSTMAVNTVDVALQAVSGFDPKSTVEPEEVDREIYECYCEIDLRGYEHMEDGEPTGLALPYRVTIDKDSKQILEIRRWWEEGDDTYTRKEVFVEYVFVPAFPGVNLGLLHILGNATRALTAAWRIALDNGMLANFPGGLMARSTGKQQTTSIRVGPGQVAPMDADGVPLKEAFMPLPYRDVTGGFVQIIQNVEQTSQRLGGTAETAVGEGRSDAPVGTTIALIDQATKVLSAVHKRMHTAQQKEFALLKDLFKKDPEALWRSNRNPAFERDVARLEAALENKDIVPKADPNTASQTLRIQKAIAIYQMAKENPAMFNQREVYTRIMGMVGIEDAESLFNNTPGGPPPIDPIKQMEANAKLAGVQAKVAEMGSRQQIAASQEQTKIAMAQAKMAETRVREKEVAIDAANHAADRRSKEMLAQADLEQSMLVHSDKLLKDRASMQADDQFRQQEAEFKRQQAMQKPPFES